MKIKGGNIRNMLRKIFRFGPYVALSNLVLVYGQRFLPAGIVGKINDDRNRRIQQKVAKYLPDGQAPVGMARPRVRKPGAVWVCWLQGEEKMPEMVRLCYKSILANANGHEVVLLTGENYREYVVMPHIAMRRYREGTLSHAHFADIIRMNLLAQQGGLWLDATMLLTAPLDERIFESPFFSVKTAPKGYFVSECRWAVFMMACGRECGIMRRVAKAFENYLNDNEILIDYFLFDHFIDILYRTDSDVRSIIDAIPFNNPAIHGLRMILADDYDERKMEDLTAETGMFKLNTRTYSLQQLDANPKSFYNIIKKKYLR